MKALFALLLTFIISHAMAQSDTTPILIYGGVIDNIALHGNNPSEDARRIYIVDGADKKLIWKSEKMITRPSISRTAKYIAFILTDELQGSQTLNHTHSFKLVIIDRAGKLIRTIKDGVNYSWNPEGNKIAYITGLRIEEKMGYEVTGSGIYDLGDGKTLKLGLRTYDLHWALLDNKIYYVDYKTGVVNRIDPLTKRSQPTSYRGIYLSPNGEYCFRPNYEGGTFGIYSKDNIDLTDEVLKTVGIKSVQQPEWTDVSKLFFKNQKVAGGEKPINVIYDLKEKTTEKFEGHIVGATNQKTHVGMLGADGIIKMKKIGEKE